MPLHIAKHRVFAAPKNGAGALLACAARLVNNRTRSGADRSPRLQEQPVGFPSTRVAQMSEQNQPEPREHPADEPIRPSPTCCAPKVSMLNQLRQWLWPDEALPRLDQAQAAPNPERAGMIRSARDYVALADGLLEVSSDVPIAPVLTLYREAIFLLLADTWAERKAMAVRFETTPESVFDEAQPADQVLASIRHLVAMHALVGPGERTTPEQRDLAHVTRGTVHRLLDARDPARPNRNLYRRLVRVIGAVLVLALCLTGLFVAVRGLLKPRDLAAGKPWHTSSQLSAAYTAKILFHTNEEMNPWFEIDLGASKSIRALQVTNRREANQERAIPLIAEVSEDRSGWREVARRETSFLVWEPSFAATKARYVRLRVPRVTMFHLEAVKVF